MPFSVILGMFPVKSLQRTAGPPFTLPPRREGTLPPVSSRRATDRTGGGGRSFARRNTQRPRFYLIFRDGTLPADPHRRKLTAASGPGRGGAEEAVRGLGPPLSRSDPRSRDPSAAQGPSSRDAAPPPPLSRPSGGCHDNANGTAANPHLPLPPFGIPAPVSRGPAPLPSRCA